MYQCAPSFVLGFHGCDRKTGEDLLSNKAVHEFSKNKYDWLGSGVYFWENDPSRAEAWANEPHLYEGAGFKEKNHIQICVRNRNCIKGYFLPRAKGPDSYPDSLLKELNLNAS